MSNCPECNQENYGSEPGPLRKEIAALNADIMALREQTGRGHEDTCQLIRHAKTCHSVRNVLYLIRMESTQRLEPSRLNIIIFIKTS